MNDDFYKEYKTDVSSIFHENPEYLEKKAFYNSYVQSTSILKLRGFDLSKNSLDLKNFEEFCQHFSDKTECDLLLLGLRGEKKAPEEKCLIFWEKDKVTPETLLNDYVEKMIKKRIANGVIITQNKCQKKVDETILKLQERSNGSSNDFNIFVTIFTKSELQYNPMDHHQQSKYTILTEKEKTDLLKILGVVPAKIPKIRIGGIICRFLGCQKGDILKIESPAFVLTGKTSISYRCVSILGMKIKEK